MLFGLTALILTGLSWCTTGVITANAPKKGLSISMVLLIGCFFFCIACIIGLAVNGELQQTSASVNWAVFAICASAGILNNLALEFTARMMSCGPQGISWAIFQSGMIFPFIMGISFFGEKLTIINGTGMVLMLTALLLFGLAKDNDKRSSLQWVVLGILAFTVNGINVALINLPSFIAGLRGTSPLLRALSASTGLVIGAALFEEFHSRGKFAAEVIKALRNPTLWLYVGIQQPIRILVQFYLMFQGMNFMAEHGMGNASYPIMVITNVGGVMLYGIFFCHERLSLMQAVGFVFCLLGIVGLSVG